MAGISEPTLIFIEVKREAGVSGDAQQEGMAHYVQACKTLAAATTHTLLPAVLLTVRSTRVSSYDPSLQALLHFLAPWVLLSRCQV